MTVVLVTNTSDELSALKNYVTTIYSDSEIICFHSASDAVSYAKDNIIDICFTDIEMNGMSGLELSYELRSIDPDICINFIADNEEYAMVSWKLNANDYIVKPLSIDKVKHTYKKYIAEYQ